ncbi:MAG: hypothetical protein IKK59_04640 [Lachnospiraceae bacterium]|nr:hypothetical protein [Lachnospiraceae bacterium]
MKKQFLLITMLLSMTLSACSYKSTGEADADIAETQFTETGSTEVSHEEEVVQADNVVKVISAESSWAFNVLDPAVVCEHADYLLKIRVITKEKTKFFVKNSGMPDSTYNVEVLDVLMNDDGSVPKNIKLADSGGGIVSMQEFIDTKDEGAKLKLNADKLTPEELEEMILIKNESYYELVQGQEYYIFVLDLTDNDIYKGYYGLSAGGYNVFQEKDGEYINVLTNAKLDIESLESTEE